MAILMSDFGRPPHAGDSTPDFDRLAREDVTSPRPPWMPRPSDSALDLLSAGAEANTEPRGHSPEDGDARPSDLIDLSELDSAPVSGPSSETKILPADQLPTGQFVAPRSDASHEGEVRETSRSPASSSGRVSGQTGGRSDRDRLLILLLASYASAATIGLAVLSLSRLGGSAHELESLPDVQPLDENEFRFVPADAQLPAGHTLEVGQSVRFGHIRIEPLKVTEGPVSFTHYSGRPEEKPPTPPVLKLWLRFTNESTGQVIAPLDAALLLTRSYQPQTDTLLANNLVFCREQPSGGPGPWGVLDHPQTSEWDLAGQQLGHRLQPGESLETYIPSQPIEGTLPAGKLLWRVHFRKGFHEASGHGVTTLIDVAFNATAVEREDPASIESPS